MKKNYPQTVVPWHTFSPEATCAALTSTEQGLSQQEAERRVRQYGLNKLTPAAGRGPIKRFFSQFHNVLVYVLLAATGVTIVMFEIFYVFNSRYLYHSVLNLHGLFGNRLVWLAIITLIAFQMALTYWQPMQVLFGTVAIDVHTWQMIVAVASSVFILVEIEKFFIRLFMPKAAAGKSRNTL